MGSPIGAGRAARFAAATLFLLPMAKAQSDVHSRLVPISSPIQHAGVYHLATGTWTRGAGLSGATGQGVIYNNTCSTGYTGIIQQNEKWQHRSCIPSPSHPSVPTITPGQSGYDESPGCRTSYLVSGFQFAYCSSATTQVDWLLEFADSYDQCGSADMVPTHAFTLPGMPGGTSIGTQNCWTIDVDLSLGGLSFNAQADGDGVFSGPASLNTFGWSWSPTNAVTGTVTGPLIAGNFDWLGGSMHPALIPCKGTDGTVWDSPVDLSEEGTGMASQDFFRLGGPNPSLQPGCYFFGFTPHADFHLRLFADGGCPTGGPSIPFCAPGEQGWSPCPCGNPPTTAGAGCNNSAGTGGALLATSGTASVSADTLDLDGDSNTAERALAVTGVA